LEDSPETAREAVQRVIDRARAEPQRLLCVVGPTGSGKTELALTICEALDGEVVSADSVQIYRGFDIGSAKPTPAELARAHHHLIGTLDPLAPMDAASWAKLADAAIADIRARGKVPVVCGGTYFWIRALVLGLVEAPAADPAIRARHRAIVDEKGRSALHDELRRIDPETAARLHPNDVVRISRALEVHELSGRTMSEWHAAHGFKARRFDATTIGRKHDPAVLTERIAKRASGMLAEGWIDETRGLLEAGYGEARAMGSVGYAEVRAHLEGKLPREELHEAIVRSTRVFARRQRTWLNHADVDWL
jgi:tRNA dimethylallyltransferase